MTIEIEYTNLTKEGAVCILPVLMFNYKDSELWFGWLTWGWKILVKRKQVKPLNQEPC